jgi:hypothetical protein
MSHKCTNARRSRQKGTFTMEKKDVEKYTKRRKTLF